MEKLIELTDTNNADLQAFLFCAEILIKESKDPRKHVTRLIVDGEHVYAMNGITARRARLQNTYEDGYYRVFRKEAQDVILHFEEDEEPPDLASHFKIDGLQPIGQVSVEADYFPAHAFVTHATNLVFRAEALKKATGLYEVYGIEDKLVILDCEVFSIAIAPIQTQASLPGM